MKANLYKSVIKTLNLIPEEYLVQVNAYLNELKHRISQKEKNRKKILSLAGSWSDMPESDFSEYLKKAKEGGNELFGRQIEL